MVIGALPHNKTGLLSGYGDPFFEQLFLLAATRRDALLSEWSLSGHYPVFEFCPVRRSLTRNPDSARNFSVWLAQMSHLAMMLELTADEWESRGVRPGDQ